MNAKGFYHNAICNKNIVYNESSKTAYLIHFDQATYTMTDDEENITSIINDLSDLLCKIKLDFY